MLLALLAPPAWPQAPPAAQSPPPIRTGYRYRVTSELVLVNVVVKDRKGNLVRGLTRDDFTLLEDGKAQNISSFDFEDVERAAPMVVTGGSAGAGILARKVNLDEAAVRDRRLLVLFYDFTSMQPEEVERAVQAGVDFVQRQMSPADLVAIFSVASSLQLNQDFTADRELLKKRLLVFSSSQGQGFENGSQGQMEGTPELGQAYTPDDSEYNTFNNDRRLLAIRAVVTALAGIEQRKSLIYFSSGLASSGLENQAALRNAANAALRANVAIYTTDLRGLEALPPGSGAQTASLRGVAAYSGAAVLSQLDQNFGSQETLSALAADTGGQAFLDTNDFSQVFRAMQADTAAYYVLGFKPANTARDGRYRKLTVKVRRPDVKLAYRAGYYAPRDFQHFTREDRDQQMQEELASELPSIDIALYIGASYFRLADNRFFVPVALVVPGSQIPFTRGGDKDKASIDIIGVLRDELGRPVGDARETVKLNLDESQQVRRKNVQYNTAFLLPPGKYKMKFVVRENQSGRLGSFETQVAIPDLKKEKLPVRISSVVLSNQVVPAKGKKSPNPLVADGRELVPNIAHVFSADQLLYLHYEVYDPARQKTEGKNGMRLLTSIQFFQGKLKVYETPLVKAETLNAPERKANVFEFQVPLARLRPGYYTCQINIIDDAAGSFVFPRLALLVKPAPAPASARLSGQ